MQIKFVEIQNYRKLKSCRVEFTDKTTLFVGANNSGKTSAMTALIQFLDKKNGFTINDFTISNWIKINQIGEKWCNDRKELPDFSEDNLGILLPTMDIWLQVEEKEIHYVTHLIPTLDWDGGLLGVRLRLEPKNIEDLHKNFLDSIKQVQETLATAKLEKDGESISLWPRDLEDYLNRKIQTQFMIKSYILDPAKCSQPENGIAQPQILPLDSQPLEGDPFRKLFLVHHINAQRGFADPVNTTNQDGGSRGGPVGNLSTQLRTYYNTHLNPTELPDPSDIHAIQAIESAQKEFDKKLKEGFKDPISELESLGYPGFSDPKITISTKLKPIDGLNHSSAIQFELMPENDQNNSLQLPEQYNGLGYQNLISIIFKLVEFRDEWMRVGKVAKKNPIDKDIFFIPPLHIVLIEEPEAHLHAQVQQVFIRQAYKVLRNHENLKQKNNFTTQLIVSTHSSHITHEMPFSCLRYFRRNPANADKEVPTSTIVNLSNVFGKGEETERFVTRYLQSTHCDLFFADAAILVEGPAERMLIPHFIRKHFSELHQKYISLLEIGGSHAHTLKSLIEQLGLTSLIITDLDSVDPDKNDSTTPPCRNKGYKTRNHTLKTWIPVKSDIDELLDLPDEEKVISFDNGFSVRVAYQSPIKVVMNSEGTEVEALPYTFEDALVLENIDLFKVIKGKGLIKKFKDAINNTESISELSEQLFKDLRKGKKAEFALDLIYFEDPNELKVPTYIHEGLTWLKNELPKNQEDVRSINPTAETIVVEEKVRI
ncbi:AAA family ATPase [Hazenella coriacea]|uniref:Putative ATP-dependent endonuclease of OLD family n=1 Tax=Hazenella coriacea TaxID=1179467 RepID=A0A4R3L575_9BACL|nr:AAA family ATPase [Hazenella coriacea]TCS93294.1 putative ATP-dependent endonuclease of OLD family [Hazenella coriacea]